MPARLTCYLPDRAAQVRVLADAGVVRLGRDPECEILVDHPSVSRAHAQIDAAPSPPELLDLGSKNGSFVDGVRVSRQALGADCWLRFGDVYCEFECLSTAQARALEQQASRRRATSAVLQRQAVAQPRFDLVLEETLRAAAELAGCERGFLLLGDPGSMSVRCAIGLDRGAPGAAAFGGSSAAVTRALQTGQPVFANDTGSAPWQGSVYRQLLRNPPPVKSGMTNPESFSFSGATWYSADGGYQRRKFDEDYLEDGKVEKRTASGWIAILQHHFFSAWIPQASDTTVISLDEQSLPGGKPMDPLRLIARSDSQASVDVMQFFQEWLTELDIDYGGGAFRVAGTDRAVLERGYRHLYRAVKQKENWVNRPLDVTFVLDRLGAKEAAIVGHSAGAFTAFAVAGLRMNDGTLRDRRIRAAVAMSMPRS